MPKQEKNWHAPLAALTTGLLYLLSRDIGPAGWLVLIAPVPILLYALSSERIWAVVWSASFARLLGALGLIHAYGSVLPWVVIAFALLAACVEFAAVVVLTRLAARRLPLWAAVLSFPCFTVAIEFLLQLTSVNGSFGALGYAIVDLLVFAQLASVGGIAALSFVAALVPMMLTLLILHSSQWRQVTVTAGIPLALISAFGLWQLSQPYENHARVALVAIDEITGQAMKGESQAASVAEAYTAVMSELKGQGVEAVVLPEKVFATREGWHEDRASGILQRAAESIDARVIAGFDETLNDGRQVNSAVIFAPHSDVQRYLKRRMVPVVESHFALGEGSLLLADRGVAICKDMDFAPMIREYGRRGATLMLAPAWDFGSDGRLHSRMAVVRGIENGFALARAAANGRLTVSDAYGRIIAEAVTSSEKPVTVVADVGLTSRRTVYSQIGDVFAWVMVAGAASLILTMATASRSARYRVKDAVPE
jgi:apolipoprotein N-acyltransferase